MIDPHLPIRAILLDLDGVLYIGDHAIRGAREAVLELRERGYRLAGITNTTTQPVAAIAGKLQALEFPFAATEIYTPAALARAKIGGGTARLYVREALLEDFAGVKLAGDDPDYVVMGDIGGEGYPPEVLKEIFGLVMEGAKVLALHKNRFWQRPDGLHLDLGAFVAAIEYATGTEATVLGKPSATFFHNICAALGVPPAEALMAGDDIESDVGGAQHAGLRTALVQTGKYREPFARQIMRDTDIRPGVTVPSIADLPDALSLL